MSHHRSFVVEFPPKGYDSVTLNVRGPVTIKGKDLSFLAPLIAANLQATNFTPGPHNHDTLYHTRSEILTLLSSQSQDNTGVVGGITSVNGKTGPLVTLSAADVGAYTTTQVNNLLAAKAPTNNAALTGSPTAPTPLTGDISTRIATTQFVADYVALQILDAAPDQLNTLNELANALGDDPNFASTITALVGGKLAKASNLSDLSDAAAARTNLGLGSAATQAAGAFATANHTHAVGDITGLQTALNTKANSNNPAFTGTLRFGTVASAGHVLTTDAQGFAAWAPLPAATGGAGDTVVSLATDIVISAAGWIDVLSFPVLANTTYYFDAFIVFQSSVTTMGVLFGVNAPANNLLCVHSQKQITVGGTPSTDMFSEAILTANDTPNPVSVAEPAQAVNLVCRLRGSFRPTVAGTFAIRMNKENVAGNATAKVGTFMSYRQL